MKQKPSDTVRVWKQATRKRLLSLLSCDFNAKRTRAENSAELREELQIQMDEKRVKLWDNIEDDVLCARKMTAIEDIAYSEWRVNGGVKECKGDLCSRIVKWLELLERFVEYQVE